jgi:hypothetical protein
MDERALLAILAAIVYSGADDPERPAGYTTAGAVATARLILDEATKATCEQVAGS